MASETPLFMTRIECPICKTVNELETVQELRDRRGAIIEFVYCR